MKIRMLTQEDWKVWKQFRLVALQNSPESFGSSYEEELNWSDSDVQDGLNKNNIFGAFINQTLIASAAFYSLNSYVKTKHRGVIWGMFTQPEYRGQGVASALIQTIITYASSKVTQLHLTCVTSNLGAMTLYQKHGFKIYGTEPRALKIGDTFFNEHLMILDLTRDSMKKFDTYLGLCTQVYDLSKPNPPEEAYAFYRNYVMNANGPILEPMCGTGRFLLPLIEEGFNVHGFDASEHMLEALHTKASAKNLNPTVWKGLVEDLKRPEKYKLIFIPDGSFGLIIEFEAVRASLKKFYDHLDDNGVFVFEGITTKWKAPQCKVWTGDVWHRQDRKFIIANFLTLPDHDDIRHSIARYELVDGNQIIQTEIEDFKVKLYNPKDLIKMLDEAGFKDIRMIQTFDMSAKPNENDEVIVYECRR
jgi:ribosomal protein S18 acetylase RimI-like enzyme/2-polyprenyl-3-methyl-5-hydroxy-6-metoxy-1,4-benzoquinol methylase